MILKINEIIIDINKNYSLITFDINNETKNDVYKHIVIRNPNVTGEKNLQPVALQAVLEHRNPNENHDHQKKELRVSFTCTR